MNTIVSYTNVIPYRQTHLRERRSLATGGLTEPSYALFVLEVAKALTVVCVGSAAVAALFGGLSESRGHRWIEVAMQEARQRQRERTTLKKPSRDMSGDE